MKFQDLTRFEELIHKTLPKIEFYAIDTHYSTEQVDAFLEPAISEIKNMNLRAEVLSCVYSSQGQQREDYLQYVDFVLVNLDRAIRSILDLRKDEDYDGIVRFKPAAEKNLIDWFDKHDVLAHFIITVGEKISELSHIHFYYPNTIKEGESIRIRWNGTPSQIGYLFTELAAKGLIDLPSSKGEGSYSRLAQALFNHFEIKGKKNVLTTIGNLAKECNPNKNTLSDTVRSRFNIPQLTDI